MDKNVCKNGPYSIATNSMVYIVIRLSNLAQVVSFYAPCFTNPENQFFQPNTRLIFRNFCFSLETVLERIP